ncbi:MAG: MobC family plasmid mobilization relaxosome protein [Faecalibacterium sp.]|nr:MobC family plasmid mobilization relaxosome protein [Ruminococcus flavefaciens]MCM1391686.1 MobC family plasmid mobilization relaxosome protein [Ruminococcus sp.]MCM1484638.1 MobC family plasmid mobilization relaxosome protein [Faecalibacterium sp.]
MKKMLIPIQFYVTKEDSILLCELARKTGLSKSKLLRYMIRNCTPVEAPPADYPKLIRELRAVGNNLNQLVVHAHTVGYINTPELQKALDDLWSIEDKVDSAFTVKRNGSD